MLFRSPLPLSIGTNVDFTTFAFLRNAYSRRLPAPTNQRPSVLGTNIKFLPSYFFELELYSNEVRALHWKVGENILYYDHDALIHTNNYQL